MTAAVDTMLFDGPAEAGVVVLLAHGAGAPMDSPFMAGMAARLADESMCVARFEFPYMAARRSGERKPPPDREPKLREAFWAAIAAVRARHPAARLFIGGKSMGGRMATMIADEGAEHGHLIAGVVCLGYPFHPPGKPERLRTAHLQAMRTPCLIVQGTRDPFGTPDEVGGYALSATVRLHWIETGDHSLKPLKSSGQSEDDSLDAAAEAIASFVDSQSQ